MTSPVGALPATIPSATGSFRSGTMPRAARCRRRSRYRFASARMLSPKSLKAARFRSRPPSLLTSIGQSDNIEACMTEPDIRTGMPAVKLSRDEFEERYRGRFVDPVFRPLHKELDAIVAAAWDAYSNS